uniref:Uncharacterized protein n=1 Tax=Romanomermis culicivorax TaxID=13658 RepID=A0A915INC9_ROMCU
ISRGRKRKIFLALRAESRDIITDLLLFVSNASEFPSNSMFLLSQQTLRLPMTAKNLRDAVFDLIFSGEAILDIFNLIFTSLLKRNS